VNFIDQLPTMPWHIITDIVFDNLNVIITFRSGNGLKVTAPDINVLESFKKEAMSQLKPDQITTL